MKNTTQPTDVYQVITDRIIALLKAGTIPWQKPWKSNESLPRNLVSKKEYRGVNTFLLHAMSYESPYWLTFKQAQALGGNVRKGEKSTPVVFWKWLEKSAEGKREGEVSSSDKRIPLLRYYSAFNVAQCDGIPEDAIPASTVTTREHAPIETAESIVRAMPQAPKITLGSNRACYSPLADEVSMPNPENFLSGEHYYGVLFHELIHSTGHGTRLHRKGVVSEPGGHHSFGSTPYATEELVAEMGAAFLSCKAGIVERTVDNSAAYIASWLERLKNDRKLVVQAAAQAQKASDFILGTKFNVED